MLYFYCAFFKKEINLQAALGVGGGTQDLSSWCVGLAVSCGILAPRPRIEPASLHWRANSSPPDHQGSASLVHAAIIPYSPSLFFFFFALSITLASGVG